MEREDSLQNVLNYIDAHITDEMTVHSLAGVAGYSVYHFSRVFTEVSGTPVMTYVTRRRLDFARYDMSCGKKVIDAAMEYGFDTHAGFTKAFRRHFGYPPSLCRLRGKASPPGKAELATLKNRYIGGNKMHPHIIELTPFSVIGYPTRHILPNVRQTADAPAFWNTKAMDASGVLTKLYATFTHSKHFEICMCYDADEKTGEFTYLLGRGIDNASDFAAIEPDMARVDIPGGLYAIFSTQPADDYISIIHDTWNDILTKWLPESEFEYDDTRADFEYYDQRDHGWYFGGKVQMDICIPIRQREDELRKSREHIG